MRDISKILKGINRFIIFDIIYICRVSYEFQVELPGKVFKVKFSVSNQIDVEIRFR